MPQLPAERLTDRALRTVLWADDEARRLGSNYLGTEHLLLAMLRDRDSAAGRILMAHGVTRESIVSALE